MDRQGRNGIKGNETIISELHVRVLGKFKNSPIKFQIQIAGKIAVDQMT